jgi:integrase
MAIMFQRLTRPMLRRLAPGGTITEHGITFERLANGDGVFTVNVMVDGKRIHRVIGRESDGTTRTQAEEFIEKVRRDAREGRLNLPKGRKIVLGFREAATRYLEKLAEEGGKDLVMKRRRLRLHLVPFFGDTPLSQISNFDIERYKKSRIGEGAKVGTVNRELAVLSHLCNKGIEWGWIDKRPAKIKRYAEERGRITYLTVDQIKRLLEVAQHDQNPQVYPFIVIGLETSMRRMEILSIRREYVDIQRRVIYIPTAKAGAREQPMTTHLATFLEGYIAALPEGSPWLFPSLAAQSGHTVDIRKPFRRVVRAAGLNPDEVVRHTLRHTAITHLVQAGVDLPTVKRISGHKTLIMVERYAHQNGAHIQAAMDALEARYAVPPLPTAQRQ